MTSDEERTVVKTYVPQYQKEAWAEHADDLDMTQSEFVRCMVQAGRRDFGVEETGSADASPGGDALETRVREVLSAEGRLGWAELLDRVASDLEDRLDEALRTLQDRGEVEHSGRRGGYALTEDGRE